MSPKLAGAAPPASRATPIAIFAWGTGIYIALAAIVDVEVVDSPTRNRFLQTFLLALLGIAFVVAADGFLAVIRAIPRSEMLGWPSRAAALGSIAYTLMYGHRVFVNYWFYDDWGYFGWLDMRPNLQYMTAPVNDHFIPLFRLLVWWMARIFGFDYIGAACLQQIAFLMLLVVLSHLLWEVSNRPWILILVVGSFALWPTYGIARTWFGGGFLLTASASLLAVYVLHTRSIVFTERMTPADIAVSAMLGTATVLISSQTLVPAVYLIAFCAPVLLVSKSRNRDLCRLGTLCAVSLLPTAVAFWGRRVYIVRAPFNTTGLFDGQLIWNSGAFIFNKVMFMNKWFISRWPMFLATMGFFVPLSLALGLLGVRRSIEADRRARLGGLLLGGSAIFILSLAQIGLGRRWAFDAVLNPYYMTFPFFGLWLTWAGIGIAFLFLKKPAVSPQTWMAVFATVVVMAAAVHEAGVPVQPTLESRLHLIQAQRQFIDDLGSAVCDLSRLHRSGSPMHWIPRSDISTCRVCQDIIAPEAFLHRSTENTPPMFESIARIAGRRSCPATDTSRVLPQGPTAGTVPSTDGSESPMARFFMQTYLGQTSVADR